MPTLRELREEQGLSQRTLARKADVSPATVLDIERHGTRPGLVVRQALAKALGVEVGAIDWPAAVGNSKAEG